MVLIDGSNYWNDCNNTHYTDEFTGRGNVIMQDIILVIIWYDTLLLPPTSTKSEKTVNNININTV